MKNFILIVAMLFMAIVLVNTIGNKNNTSEEHLEQYLNSDGQISEIGPYRKFKLSECDSVGVLIIVDNKQYKECGGQLLKKYKELTKMHVGILNNTFNSSEYTYIVYRLAMKPQSMDELTVLLDTLKAEEEVLDVKIDDLQYILNSDMWNENAIA